MYFTERGGGGLNFRERSKYSRKSSFASSVTMDDISVPFVKNEKNIGGRKINTGFFEWSKEMLDKRNDVLEPGIVLICNV